MSNPTGNSGRGGRGNRETPRSRNTNQRGHVNREQHNENQGLHENQIASGIYIAYFDGSAHPNPGQGGAGWVIIDALTQATIRRDGRVVDISNTTEITSNQAEYFALICVLRECIALGATDVLIRGDSELVISQMEGGYRVLSPNLLALHSEAEQLSRRIANVRFEAIQKEYNREADTIANRFASIRRRPDYSDAWLAALQQGVGNVDYHTSLIRVLTRIPEDAQAWPPSILPPPHQATQNSNNESGRSTPVGSVITQSDLTESSNSFAHLETEDEDEEDDEELPQDTQPAAASAGSRNGSRRSQVSSSTHTSRNSTQVRYLLRRAECGLAEAYRQVAEKEAHHDRWVTCASSWCEAYSILNLTLRTMDPWLALLLDYEENGLGNVAGATAPPLNDRHDPKQLHQLQDVITMVEQTIEEKRHNALGLMDERMRVINHRLQPLRNDRDRVRHRIGDERWVNNPAPRMTYAEMIIALHNEKIQLQKAIADVSSLRLR